MSINHPVRVIGAVLGMIALALVVARVWLEFPDLWFPIPERWWQKVLGLTGARNQEDVANIEFIAYFLISLLLIALLVAVVLRYRRKAST